MSRPDPGEDAFDGFEWSDVPMPDLDARDDEALPSLFEIAQQITEGDLVVWNRRAEPGRVVETVGTEAAHVEAPQGMKPENAEEFKRVFGRVESRRLLVRGPRGGQYEITVPRGAVHGEVADARGRNRTLDHLEAVEE